MDDTTKLFLGIGAGVGILLLTVSGSKRSPAGLRMSATQRRVMSYSDIMWQEGQALGVEPAILAAIMQKESGGNPSARGALDEIGIMQIRPGTASTYCIEGPGSFYLLPVQTNIRCGAKIFAAMLKIFHSVPAAISAYNAGPGNVSYNPDTGALNVINKRYVLDVIALVSIYRPIFQSIYGAAYTAKFPATVWSLHVNLV